MIFILVILSGAAALSWEILWQIEASLALGVSAMGTAIALVATMGGMTLGSLTMGRYLSSRPPVRPEHFFTALECVIGISGVFLVPGFADVAALDRWVWLRAPELAPALHLIAILAVIGPASIAMGATLPVYGHLAQRKTSSLAVLYGLNTAGAAAGVLAISFALLPTLGIEVTATLLSCVNLAVAALSFILLRKDTAQSPATAAPVQIQVDALVAATQGKVPALLRYRGLVFATGFVTLGLEVTWFRSLRAAFWSTTDSFAIMLTAVLLPLAAGAPLARWAARRAVRVETLVAFGGVAVLLGTPVVERFDLIFANYAHGYLVVAATWLLLSLAALGPAVVLLGSALPLLLDKGNNARAWARLYAASTLGGVLGSLCAAWILLPLIGSERSAWVLGTVACGTVMVIGSERDRTLAAALCGLGVLVAVAGQSGAGRTRVQGILQAAVTHLLASHEGPDATIAVADDVSGDRVLIIDGFSATTQGQATHYMAWMGRLPMLLHPHPKRALVICFGTGQTANGVREEGPSDLDIVEINPAVFAMASYFPSNGGVLTDPRVHPIVMDGRAWLRRTSKTYDVITLEPMPPNFAGVNALYSLEFYQLAAQRLQPGGLLVQWLPFHLVSLHDAGAIVATFQRVFNDAILWIDPVDQSGILVGRLGAPSADFGASFPDLQRARRQHDMNPNAVLQSVALRAAGLARWAELARSIITDDNQLLAYGLHRGRGNRVSPDHMARHFALVRELRAQTWPR